MPNRSARENPEPTSANGKEHVIRLSWIDWWVTRGDWGELDRILDRFPHAERRALRSHVCRLVHGETTREGYANIPFRGCRSVTILLRTTLPRALSRTTAPQCLSVLEAATRLSREGTNPDLFIKFGASVAADLDDAPALESALQAVGLFREAHPYSWEQHLDSLLRALPPAAVLTACRTATHLRSHGVDTEKFLSTGWPAAAGQLSTVRLEEVCELTRQLGIRRFDPGVAVEALAGLQQLTGDEWASVLASATRTTEHWRDPGRALQLLRKLAETAPSRVLPLVLELCELLSVRPGGAVRDRHLEHYLDEIAFRAGQSGSGPDELVDLLSRLLRQVREHPDELLAPVLLAATCSGCTDAEALRRLRDRLANVDADADLIGAARRLPADLLELALVFRQALLEHGRSTSRFLQEATESTLRPTGGIPSASIGTWLPEEVVWKLARLIGGQQGLASALRGAIELAPHYDEFLVLHRDSVTGPPRDGKESYLPPFAYVWPGAGVRTQFALDLTLPAALTSWIALTHEPLETERMLRRLLDLQTRLPGILELLDACGVLRSPAPVRSVYLCGSFAEGARPNDLNLFLVLPGEAPYARHLPSELAEHGFPQAQLPAPLSLEWLGEQALDHGGPGRRARDPLDLFRARLHGMALLAGDDVRPDAAPPYGGFIHLRRVLWEDAERGAWPELHGDAPRLQARRRQRTVELGLLRKQLGFPPDGEDFALLLKNATNLLAIEVLASALQEGFDGLRRDASPAAREHFRQYYGASFEFAHAMIRSLTGPATADDRPGAAQRAAARRAAARRILDSGPTIT